MLRGDGRTVTRDNALYDCPKAHEGRDSRCYHHAWQFVGQVSVLLWKEFLSHVRRPWMSLLELLLPALVVVVFGYAVALCPAAWIEPFVYTRVPEITPHSIIPNENLVQLVWERDVEAVTDWRGVFNELNLSSFLTEYAVVVAKLRRGRNIFPEFYGVPWRTEDVVHTLLSNRYAAMPFKVPTFDAYVDMINAASVEIGKLGLKHTMMVDPLIHFIFRFGKLAFAVKDDHDSNLIIAGERLVEYLNVTTKAFRNTVICRSQTVLDGNKSCLFNSVREVTESLKQQQLWQDEMLWAVVQLEKISVQPTEFRYNVLINETIIGSSATIEAFPQGLGKDYAMNAYNGVLTLQYELNTYFNRLAKHPGRRRNLSLTSLVDVICSTVPSANNATQNMFEQPEEEERRDFIKNATERMPIQVLSSEPFVDVNAIYAPCLYEVDAFCSATNDTESLLKCLKDNVSEPNMTRVCRAAVNFVRNCLPIGGACKNMDPYSLLTNTSFLLPQCAESMANACGEGNFIKEVHQTKSTLRCAEDLKRVCNTGGRSIFNQCMDRSEEAAASLSNECRAVLDSFSPCVDEYSSICPLGKLGESGSIPYGCLYKNRRILSAECKDTNFVKNVLPYLYSQKAVKEEIPASMYYCREVHDIYKTLHTSVVLEAFPTNGYTQYMFFLTGGPFIGLVLVVAYYFPFVSTIQSIVHERDSWKHQYLIIIGTHPLAIFLSKFLSVLIVSIITSLITTLVVIIFVDVPGSWVYSLLYMYSLCIGALGMVVGQLITNERSAASVAPFIVFLFVAPALVGDQPTELKGASMILPQTVLAKAFTQCTRVVQKGFVGDGQPFSISRPLWILFGLVVFYSLIAILLEYVFLPNSPLERMLRRFTAWVTQMMHQLKGSGNHQAVRSYEEEEMISRDRVVSFEEERKNKEFRERMGRESNLKFNIGGISNDPHNGLGRQEHIAVAGVALDGMSREGAETYNSETLAFLLSRDPEESEVECPSGIAPRIPNNWRSAITVRGIYMINPLNIMKPEVPSADFYQNQLNCVVGGDTSGRRHLMAILMGWSDQSSGEVNVDGRGLYLGKRVDIGVCLEKTVLWENLTVMENIRLVQMLKGRTSEYDELENESGILFSALQLTSVSRELAGRLSSGMARKLAVAMALAGGSRTLLFDEPTSSTDSSSRREIWHLLSQNAAGRCIVVSTSDVEEVDTYADHVTVLFGGRITLAGTPEYIRGKLGGGWVVTVCRATTTRVAAVIDYVLSVVPEAQVVSGVGREVSFRLTRGIAEAALDTLITKLQQTKEAGLITSIMVSETRLSEIFVRLTRVLDLQESQRGHEQVTTENTPYNGDYIAMPPLSPSNNNNNNNNNNTNNNNNNNVDASIVNTWINLPESREEFEFVQKWKFLTTYRAFLYYRVLEAISTPLYGILLMLLPLMLIFLALSTWGNTFNRRKLEATSVFNWHVFSTPSVSFYSDFGGITSPYRTLPDLLDGKVIPGTSSLFTNVASHEDLTINDRSSAFMDRFLRENVTSHVFHFGAFVMQGPFIRSTRETPYPGVFPWLTDVVLCNTSFPPSVAAYMQILGMMRLWVAENNTKGIISASLGVLGGRQQYDDSGNNYVSPVTTVDVMSTLLLVLPFTFYGTRMVSDLVQQRYSGLLQVFYTSSLRPLAFWASNFTYDTLAFSIFGFLAVATYIAAGVTIEGDVSYFLIYALIIVFGSGTISLSYLVSKWFDNPLSAQSTITAIGIFTGVSFLIASSAVRFLPSNPMTDEAKQRNEVYSFWMRLLPHYCLGETFLNYSMRSISFSYVPSLFRLRTLLILPALLIILVVYETMSEIDVRIFVRDRVSLVVKKNMRRFGLFLRQWTNRDATLLLDEGGYYRWEYPPGLIVCEDVSVTNERGKGYTADGLHVKELWKLRNNVYALQNITMNVENETLVVVGINGSGKTSLLKCLAGDSLPSYGSIFVNGLCCTGGNLSKLRAVSGMGYSTESLILEDSNITPYRFLNIVADLRLLRRNATRSQHILFIIRTLGIDPYMHCSMRILSVSIQRRVGLAAALIGYPPVLILDDVTNSLDPLTKRRVWAAIKSAANGTAVVISTKTPDDVDMLGDRVLLLDEGAMRYIGTPAAWREKYRKGFYVTIDVSRSYEPLTQRHRTYSGVEEILSNFFSHYWNESSLVESQPFHYAFHIPFYTFTKKELSDSNVHMSRKYSTPTTAGPSPRRNSVKSILATLIQGRREGWLVETGDEPVSHGMRGSRYSITVSEVTIKHTAMNAFGESISFQRSTLNLYNRSVYVPPRDRNVSL